MGCSLYPASEAIQKPLAFTSAGKKTTEISAKCQLVGTVLLTSKSILVSLVHFTTDIRCGQWDTLCNERAGQQNYTSVQLETPFLTFPGVMLLGRRKGRCWGRWPVKQRERHRDLVTHTSTKDIMISFGGLLLLSESFVAQKTGMGHIFLPYKNWGVVQKKNRTKKLILPSNLGISERSWKNSNKPIKVVG